MNSASNRPPHPGGGRDPRLAGAPQGPSGAASPDDQESPGEQTVTFGAIRPDDDEASIRARTRLPGGAAGGTSGPTTPGQGAGPAGAADSTSPPASNEAMAAFHAAAAAAEATIAALTASRETAARQTSPGPSRSGPAAASLGAGAPVSPGVPPGQRPSAPAPRAATFRQDTSLGRAPGRAPAPGPTAGPVAPSAAGPGSAFRPGAPVSRPANENLFSRPESSGVGTGRPPTPPLRVSRTQEGSAKGPEIDDGESGDTPRDTTRERHRDGPENGAGQHPLTGGEESRVDAGIRENTDDPPSRDYRAVSSGGDQATEIDDGAERAAATGGGTGIVDEAGRDAEAVEIDAETSADDGIRDEPDDETGIESDGAGGETDVEWPGDRMRETSLPDAVSEALSAALAAVRAGVTDLGFGLDIPGAQEARRVQAEILAQLDDYVIPRVHMSTAPALVVVAGSTGAGKSTLLNTLANAKVSATGVRRPTTGMPVLACHPDDHEWFAKGELLGSLRRFSEPDPDAASGGLVLVSSERLPAGLALLDTPDIDSVVEEHHEIAHRMLDAADLWIFVTTAARYADAPAWRLLRLAKERGARLAIVLSRVPPKSREVITKHFVRMLTEYGLGEVDRFVIDEGKVTDGMLPDHEVSELRRWLTELSVDERRRAQAVRVTLDGVLNSFRTRVPALAKQLEIQVAFRRDLRADVDGAYAGALAEIGESTGDGSLLRGEVLARWQDFAGSGDLMRTLHLRKPGRFAGKASQQAPERLSALKSALRVGLESVIVSAAQRAAEEVASRWLNRPGAKEILAAEPDLGRASDELVRRAGRTIAAWQEHIAELIRTEGVTKRAVARVISFDVESLSLILTIGLFGYTSSEAGDGTGALPQRLVHALLGAESLRNIGMKARSDLRARVGMLFDDEMARYIRALDGAGIPDESAAKRLYQATYNLEVAR